ncbi:AT-hook motif nuclear-localized protein 1-like [Mangifera indica]|uniref:AT-hook motif nuclear-localized protein 1-like n=1 Tax=Mangifera indica TaxID=29780 RepID=UPI001CF9311E|nr:AT-hook motif nuclear-localized protein 1-like [Mangifera indica]
MSILNLVKYYLQGRFEIPSLTGSFTVSDTSGVRSRTSGLSVSLAGPDGRVIGGGLAGLLLAASPIQIVVGSFMPNGYKVHKRKHHREHDRVTASRLISQVKPDGGKICLTTITPIMGQNHPEMNNIRNNEQLPNVTSSPSLGWNGSQTTSNQGSSPDINVSLLSE